MMDVDVAAFHIQTVLPLVLYRTWYLVMGRSLEGAVQLIVRAGLPECTALVRLGGFTLEGAVSENRYVTIATHYLHIVQ